LIDVQINDPDQLTASYPGFVAQTLQTEEYNHVYIRGRAEDDKQLAHVDVALSTFTNELILWPQVLHGAKSLGHIPLNYNPDRKNEGVPGGEYPLPLITDRGPLTIPLSGLIH
jgi:hypothetical protein